jgi:predicted regulator of Ras-like GTPase activity (Roadblock/LC7/MglB family)
VLGNEPFTAEQPSVQGLVERACTELSAKAVVLLHENGQMLQRSGWIDESEYPAMSALIAAMIAAGKSLSQLGESALGEPSRFACDSEASGLYTVGVSNGIWLSVLYDQPLNPGQFRMKVRRYAELLARLGVSKPTQWEVTENVTQAGATLPPVSSREAKTTPVKPTLFGEISDSEIDELFENARS